MTGKKSVKHSFLISAYILVSLLLFMSLLLFWSYQESMKVIDKEVHTSFQQRHIIIENEIEKQLELIKSAMHEIADNNEFLNTLSVSGKSQTEKLFLSAVDKNTQLNLDIVFLSIPNYPVWIDASSPFFDTKDLLTKMVKGTDSESDGLFHYQNEKQNFTLLFKTITIIYETTGKVLGQIYGGIVIDNNFNLMENIRKKTKLGSVTFFINGKLVATSNPVESPSTNFLSEIKKKIKKGEIYASQKNILFYEILEVDGGNASLEIIVSIPNATFVNLKESYQKTILLIFLLSVIFSIASIWIIRILTTPSFDKLLTYSKKIISGDMKAVYQKGKISELNELGQSMEKMVESLVTTNKELNYYRKYLSNIIDSMPSIIVGLDTNCKVTQWNLGAAKNTGISTEQALGKFLPDVLPHTASEIIKIKKAIQTRQIIKDSQKKYNAKNGICYEDITIFPLAANGVLGAVIRIDDVTEKIKMEELMIQSEKMLSVGGLAAGMAHEINNPLAGMIQTANVMKERLSNIELSANQRVASEFGIEMMDLKAFMEKRGILRMIETINTSGKRVAEIVMNMLSFARKGDSAKSSYNLVELLDKTLELAETDYDLKKQFDFRQIKIVKDYQNPQILVPCEGAKVQQVLLNILRNGAQAMQDAKVNKPQFNICTKINSERNIFCMEIQDNGPGMDEIIRKRIFEPFFTTKPVGIGTGLGLSVSYFIITENHGGELLVESKAGEGAKFTICLPIE